MHNTTGLRRSLWPAMTAGALLAITLLGCSADPDEPVTDDPPTD